MTQPSFGTTASIKEQLALPATTVTPLGNYNDSTKTTGVLRKRSTSSTSSREWPVRVFRQILQDGDDTTNRPSHQRLSTTWQRLRARRNQSNSEKSTSSPKSIMVKASPRNGCIVLKRLQIRIRLSRQEQDLRMTLTRRKKRLLIASNQRLRVLMLQFGSEKECWEFCDELVALNPSLEPVLANTNDQHDQQQHQKVVSYIFRLLHDPEFAAFCRHLESSLLSTPDGRKAIEALVETKDT